MNVSISDDDEERVSLVLLQVCQETGRMRRGSHEVLALLLRERDPALVGESMPSEPSDELVRAWWARAICAQ